MTRLVAVILVVLISSVVSFRYAGILAKRPPSHLTTAARIRTSDSASSSPKDASSASGGAVVTKPAYVAGEDLPEEIMKQSVIYDMLLVERINTPTTTNFGLFLPKVDGKDLKHTAVVISIPTEYGLESEQGRVQPPEEICPYKKGDVVFVRDPWGIGPKDIQIGERCFSFHKAAQITGVISRKE
jgi:co-chaperonin GroES (HSP10)